MITDRKNDLVKSALEQMEKLIKRFIDSSMSGDLFDKALQCLEAMRDGCVKEDEAETFNTFAR
jgi:ATP-dependent DNA helicase 2 subunit 2